MGVESSQVKKDENKVIRSVQKHEIFTSRLMKN